MNVFFDRNVAIRLARMVAGYEGADVTVQHLDDCFDKTTPDVEWMRAVAARGSDWVVISNDNRLLRNEVERKVLIETGLTYFILSKGWTGIPIHEQACKLLRVWPVILKTASTTRIKSAVFVVSVSSLKVDLLEHP